MDAVNLREYGPLNPIEIKAEPIRSRRESGNIAAR